MRLIDPALMTPGMPRTFSTSVLRNTTRRSKSCYLAVPRLESRLPLASSILGLMILGHGYKAQYDYVELTVEQRAGHWRLTLRDNRHGEDILHEEEFATTAEAQDAALPLAQHHINIQHNDTLLMPGRLSWKEY